jgi:DNA modification methylase
MKQAFETLFGKAFIGDSLELLESLEDGSVNLVITSPPFSCNARKIMETLNSTNMLNG